MPRGMCKDFSDSGKKMASSAGDVVIEWFEIAVHVLAFNCVIFF